MEDFKAQVANWYGAANVIFMQAQQWVQAQWGVFETCRSKHQLVVPCAQRWWTGLQEHEQQAVIIGASIAVVFSAVFFIVVVRWLFRMGRGPQPAAAVKNPKTRVKRPPVVVEAEQQETSEAECNDGESEGEPLIASDRDASHAQQQKEQSGNDLPVMPVGEQIDTTISSDDEDNTSKDAELEPLSDAAPPTPSAIPANVMFQEIETMRKEFRDHIHELETQLESEKKQFQAALNTTTSNLQTEKLAIENELKELQQKMAALLEEHGQQSQKIASLKHELDEIRPKKQQQEKSELEDLVDVEEIDDLTASSFQITATSD